MEARGPRMCHCRDRVGDCGYFVWYDPPICNRAKQIIPHLLNRIGKYRAKEKTYWACMLLSWLITFVMVMLYANYKPKHVKPRPMLSLP
ncbi:hypothetical protein L1049_023117 [Liquidambar formosana]|uniref:Zinc finger, GRF-type n=1 Tax=Liquidambar formosana TaxID=63359 RepID=A0AAP0WPX3_LIQFO